MDGPRLCSTARLGQRCRSWATNVILAVLADVGSAPHFRPHAPAAKAASFFAVGRWSSCRSYRTERRSNHRLNNPANNPAPPKLDLPPRAIRTLQEAQGGIPMKRIIMAAALALAATLPA